MERFEIMFGGTVDDIPIEFDMNSRSKVMRTIDRARAKGKVLRFQPFQRNALLLLTGSVFKIVTNDNNQDVLVRMPMHQVACVSYLYEDDQHIVAIKYGEVDSIKNDNMEADEDLICHMVIAFCDVKDTAVDLCNSVERFFEETLERERFTGQHRSSAALSPNQNHRQDINIPKLLETKPILIQNDYSFLSNSCRDLRSVEEPPAPRGKSVSPGEDRGAATDEPSTSSVQLTNIEQKLIMDYMKKLYNVLDPKELEEFARLVKAWHCDMSFDEFCSRLLVLYGPGKKYLLAEMRPFIPAKDCTAFELFLKRNCLDSDG